jgi:hypothetical protein
MGGEVQFFGVGPAGCFQLIRHEMATGRILGDRPRLRDSEGVDARRGGNPE